MRGAVCLLLVWVVFGCSLNNSSRGKRLTVKNRFGRFDYFALSQSEIEDRIKKENSKDQGLQLVSLRIQTYPETESIDSKPTTRDSFYNLRFKIVSNSSNVRVLCPKKIRFETTHKDVIEKELIWLNEYCPLNTILSPHINIAKGDFDNIASHVQKFSTLKSEIFISPSRTIKSEWLDFELDSKEITKWLTRNGSHNRSEEEIENDSNEFSELIRRDFGASQNLNWSSLSEVIRRNFFISSVSNPNKYLVNTGLYENISGELEGTLGTGNVSNEAITFDATNLFQIVKSFTVEPDLSGSDSQNPVFRLKKDQAVTVKFEEIKTKDNLLDNPSSEDVEGGFCKRPFSKCHKGCYLPEWDFVSGKSCNYSELPLDENFNELQLPINIHKTKLSALIKGEPGKENWYSYWKCSLETNNDCEDTDWSLEKKLTLTRFQTAALNIVEKKILPTSSEWDQIYDLIRFSFVSHQNEWECKIIDLNGFKKIDSGFSFYLKSSSKCELPLNSASIGFRLKSMGSLITRARCGILMETPIGTREYECFNDDGSVLSLKSSKIEDQKKLSAGLEVGLWKNFRRSLTFKGKIITRREVL